MDTVVILAILGLILSLVATVFVQMLLLTGKISSLCGKFEIHMESCDQRFKQIESRLEKADL